MKKLKCSITQLVPRLGGLFCGEKPLAGFFLKRKGFSINADELTKSELDELISQDKLVGMIGYFSVEDNDQDADYATSVNKLRRKTINGTKGYRFTFDKGSCFQNQLAELDGSENYEFIPVFEDGSWLWAVNKDGSIKGFECRLFVGIKKLQTSADVAGSTLEVDITPNGMIYWQNSSQVFESDEYSANEINPIAGLEIELPILKAAATTTTIKVSEVCADSPVSGLTKPANWKIEVDGVASAITGTITEVNGSYTLTHSALVAGKKVRFYIDVLGYPVYVLDNNYYAGSSKIETVVA